MRWICKILTITSLLLFSCFSANAQEEGVQQVETSEDTLRFAVKTNLLYDAASVVNFAVEVPIKEKYSVLYEHHCPWWLWGGNKYCIELLSFGGEFRWWFKPQETPTRSKQLLRDELAGHFVGVYGWGGIGDFQWGRDFGCYQFDFWSAGLTYGYSKPIGKKLNLEFSISAGYANIPYKHYVPSDDWEFLVRDPMKEGTLKYLGITKIQISLVMPIQFKWRGK